MRAYTDLQEVVMPYVMTASMPLFRSAVVNTDDYGFRISCDRQGLLDSRSWWGRDQPSIVLGGSFTFGVGATHDSKTLVSALNGFSGCSFLNLGIRAANSTQGVIAAIPFLADSHYVVVCGGFNTLVANLQSIGRFDLFGPFAQEHLFARFSAYTIPHLLKVVSGQPPVSLRPKSIARESVRRLRLKFSRLSQEAGGQDWATSGSNSPAEGDEILAKTRRALAIQQRDLSIIIKACSPSTRVIFALQPFGLVSKPNLTEEEEQLFELRAPRNRRVRELVYHELVRLWPQYTLELHRTCDELGVTFTDLNTTELKGWCYVDPAHMNDAGYEQVAKHLKELLK